MTESVTDITRENYQQLLTEESFKRPVVIDFWADWCAPCKMLMPVLEKLAEEYQGQFLLARLDTQADQEMAAQFQVRSIPTVMVIRDGKRIDEFTGALPESEVRAFIDKNLPRAWEPMLQEISQYLEQGDIRQAVAKGAQAYALAPDELQVVEFYVHCLVEDHQYKLALEVLAGINGFDITPSLSSLKARAELGQNDHGDDELTSLESEVSADPDNLDLRYQLAMQLSSKGKVESALENLLFILTKDKLYKDGEARQLMLDSIKSLGPGHPVATQYQRRLFTLIY